MIYLTNHEYISNHKYIPIILKRSFLCVFINSESETLDQPH